MKKNLLLKGMLFALIAVQFTSCDNEPLEGEFIQDNCTQTAGVEEIRANIDGTDYIATIVDDSPFTQNSALLIIHENDFTHISIAGIHPSLGDLAVDVINPAVGIFNLGTNNEFGYVSNENNHILHNNFGYYKFDPAVENSNPYVSYTPNGGSGELEITAFDLENETISGTFSFIGVRVKRDPDTGEDVLDSNGAKIIEFLEVPCGSFNNVPFSIFDQSQVLGGEFFAKVDEVEFTPEMLTVTQVTVAEIPMINVIAIKGNGESIRIDFPESIGLGTFAMEPISNGTKIIGLYDASAGTENLTSNPGTLTITEYDSVEGTIVASFEFTGTDPLGMDPTVVEITEGSFTLDNLDLTLVASNLFNADVDGETFNPDDILAGEAIINGITVVTISATNTETNQNIGFVFPADITEGTYNLNSEIIIGDEKAGFYTPDLGNSITYSSNPGTLTIISIDPVTGVFVGSFQFIASDPDGVDPTTYTITNGEFTVIAQ